jgi:hypothetical protein
MTPYRYALQQSSLAAERPGHATQVAPIKLTSTGVYSSQQAAQCLHTTRMGWACHISLPPALLLPKADCDPHWHQVHCSQHVWSSYYEHVLGMSVDDNMPCPAAVEQNTISSNTYLKILSVLFLVSPAVGPQHFSLSAVKRAH